MQNMLPFLLLLLVVSAAARIPRNPHVVHEKRSVEEGHAWSKRSRADANSRVRVRVGLTQRNLEHGYDLLMKVSHPDSDQYGRHYSAAEVVDLFAPSNETVKNVQSWLERELNGTTITSSNTRQWLHFESKISKLEMLLGTTYHEYENTRTGKLSLGCDSYHVPAYLRKHIDFITPGLTMAETLKALPLQRRGMRTRPIIPPSPIRSGEAPALDAASSCSSFVTPECVRLLYGVQDQVTSQPGNGIGVYESFGDFLDITDLNNFFQTYFPRIPQGTYPETLLVDGAPDPRLFAGKANFSPGGESALDFQLIYPLVYPTPVELFQVDDLVYETQNFKYGLFNTFLDYLDASYCNRTAYGISGDSTNFDAVYPDPSSGSGAYKGKLQCGVARPPPVISISYSPDEKDLSAAYQRRQCSEFMKLGMQGISIFGASGDSGVASNEGQCYGPQKKTFEVLDLTNCPFITGVGATELPSGGIPGQTREVATTQFSSSGGFSNVYTTPDYQKTAVSTYFAKYDPGYSYYQTQNHPRPNDLGGTYNRIGRGVPDVAAIGVNIVVAYNGSFSTSGGTSASAPIWAGLITRINAARIAAGKSTVGFVNPVLYAHPEVFNDVVTGSNPGCGLPGFNCTPGWDPVTGLGAPVYSKLKALFLGLN